MSEQEEVDIKFDVDDKATPKLTRLEKAAERLDKGMARASERFMRFAEVAGGALGVIGGAESLRGAKEYIEHVRRISNLTGIAADRAAGMSEALQEVGVESGEVEGMLTRMTKRTALLSEENKAMVTMAARYGVNLEQGPQKALIKMSKLVEEHKIGAGQVGRILGVQGRTLSDLMAAMNKGPQELNAMFDDATRKSAFLGGQSMAQMQSFNEATERVHGAWRRLVAGVIVKVAPSLTTLAGKLEGSIDGWVAKAQKFASFMVTHMTTLISMAKTYAKVMLVNNLLEKVTGKGIVGNVMRLGANTGGGFFGGIGGSGAVKLVKELFTGVVKIRPLLTIFARFAAVAAVVGIIYYLFMKITTATEGAGVRIRHLFESIWTNLQAIGKQIMSAFSADSTMGKFFRWLGEEGLLGVIEKIAALLNEATMGLRLLTIMLTERVGPTKARTILRDQVYDESGLKKMLNAGVMVDLFKGLNGKGGPSKDLVDKFTEFERARSTYAAAGGSLFGDDTIDKLRKRYGNAVGTTNKQGATPETSVYQDFRGSRFDVTQQFAEGFDPDRIAVGFANDIASLGERRLQSGFSPLFAVR